MNFFHRSLIQQLLDPKKTVKRIATEPEVDAKLFSARLDEQLRFWKRIMHWQTRTGFVILENKEQETIGFIQDRIVVLFHLDEDKKTMKISSFFGSTLQSITDCCISKEGLLQTNQCILNHELIASRNASVLYTLPAKMVQLSFFVEFQNRISEYMMVTKYFQQKEMAKKRASLHQRLQDSDSTSCASSSTTNTSTSTARGDISFKNYQ
jgi:hypothetical protein